MNCKIVQKKYLSQLLKKNKNTLYGIKNNFAEIFSYEEFQKKVPVTYYEDYVPYIKNDDASKVAWSNFHKGE